MTQPSPARCPLESDPINLPEEGLPPLLLAWMPPVVQDLYQRDLPTRLRLAPLLHQLGLALAQLSLHVGAGSCPHCSTSSSPQPLTPYKTLDKPVLTTGNIKLLIHVSYYRCPKCKFRPAESPDLTLPGGLYDRGLVLDGVALYTCGSSYEHTRGLLTTRFGITPALSTLQNWVQHLGSTAHQLNQAALAPLQVPELRIDELATAVRDGQEEAHHTPVFSTVLQEGKFGAILHLEVLDGVKTNLLIVESALRRVAHHHPARVLGDGEASYPGAVAHVFPDAEFIRDLVHEVRNVRKKKRVQQQLDAAVAAYKATLTTWWQTCLQQDRAAFTAYLDQICHAYEATAALETARQTAWATYETWEAQEIAALEEQTEHRGGIFRQCLPRRLYCGRAAARLARAQAGEAGPTSQLRTTNGLEGFNRVLRARERRALCYRAKRSVAAVQGLLLLQHNMVGTGTGCLYDLLGVSRPSARWNPFAGFPPRHKSLQAMLVPQGTPLRQVSTRYRQQHSHQLNLPLDREWKFLRGKIPLNSQEVLELPE